MICGKGLVFQHALFNPNQCQSQTPSSLSAINIPLHCICYTLSLYIENKPISYIFQTFFGIGLNTSTVFCFSSQYEIDLAHNVPLPENRQVFRIWLIRQIKAFLGPWQHTVDLHYFIAYFNMRNQLSASKLLSFYTFEYS